MQKIEVNVQTGVQKIVDMTAEEIAAMPEPVLPTYAELRVQAYPPIGDQLDALWKGGEEAAAMLAKVQAVKAKYPKEQA